VNSAALDPKFDPDAMNKGITPGAFEDYPLDQWNAAMNVNLTGMFLVTQACVKPMIAQGKKGSIINICSTYGLNGPDQRIYVKEGKRVAFKPVYYTVSKAGVMGFTKYLAAYYAETEIRVNALTPGGVYNNHEEYFVKNYSAKTILGRMAKKDEMNGALLFLASDASSYMTGNNVVVDGGWTAW
jgi:2-deoxy-D-gluconate 3-dehydrogenase